MQTIQLIQRYEWYRQTNINRQLDFILGWGYG